jgi:hypothetical protein
MRILSILAPRLGLGLGSLALISAAYGQFNYTGSTIATNVNFGDQDANSYQSDYQDLQSSNALANGSVGSTDSYSGNAYSYTYYGVGSASMTSLITDGGFLETFNDTSQVQQLAGGNSFVGPASKSLSDADILFNVTSSGAYSLVATGQIYTAVENNDYSFMGVLTDTTTNTQIQTINVAAASSSLSPLSTTVNLIAGDSYELSFYALSYDVVPGQAGASDVNAGGFDGYVQIGTPSSAPEPFTIGFFAVTAGALVRRHRSRRS